MSKKSLLILFVLVVFTTKNWAQNISLLQQFNGRYDFIFAGNTLNKAENGTGNLCEILTTSADIISLNTGDTVEAAYLYWAGSGTGDFNIKLNNLDITAQRQFNINQTSSQLPFFSAFADITTIVQTSGSATYTISDLDLTNIISNYCGNATNFGGWAIIIVYKNNALPLNQLNIYDGLQFVPSAIDITLNSLNVIDNVDAKIGFVAWEGDRSIANNESLRINGNTISNPPLNPADNAFNGTNSTTGSTTLYNMDLDIYNIQNNINVGDTSATIQLTSNQDFVMVNAIVTKLNSQLPDATIKINTTNQTCNTRQLAIEYEVSNFNSTKILPTGTFITFYANNVAFAFAQTTADIAIGATSTFFKTLTIPSNIPPNFTLKCIVDDNNGIATIAETNENNNVFVQEILLWLSPEINNPADISICKNTNDIATFDFSAYSNSIKQNATDIVGFFETLQDANANQNPILNTSSYSNANLPKTIFVRIENGNCVTYAQFNLIRNNCSPEIYTAFSPNNDGVNDIFIKNLENFPKHELFIYNRWGTLVWKNKSKADNWDGNSNQNAIISRSGLPTSTYYYILNLNDDKYLEPIIGWVYLEK